jgi:ribonuclease D
MGLEQLIYAQDPVELTNGLAALNDLDVIGVDVERADGLRYYRAAALIQVGGQGRVTVIDPLALPDLAALHEFFQDRVVVLHAMENDLPPLEVLGVAPEQIEDTAIAAAILGLPIGLEGLLASLLGVELPGDKQAMQRADWEARPLDEAMLRYAAADVADLPALWTVLAGHLEEKGRTAWYHEELHAIRSQPSVEERRDWTKTRGIGKLGPQGRTRLQALWETREALARQTDTAPARVLPDRVLVDLAANPPSAVTELGRRGMRRASVRKFGAAIVAALGQPGTPEPVVRESRRPKEEDRAAAERLRAIRAQRAAELELDPGVLCPNRHLLGAVLAEPADRDALRAALDLRDWQWEQLGDAFCEALGIDDGGQADRDGVDRHGGEER